MRFTKTVRVSKVSYDVLLLEIAKKKDLNKYCVMSVPKLIDYAILKTFNPQLLEVLKKQSDYKRFLELYEDK